MSPADYLALYGTSEKEPACEEIRSGAVSLSFGGGALRHIRCDGREIIRQIAFLARDRDWGTIRPEIGPVSRSESADGLSLSWSMRFENEGARLDLELSLLIGAERLRFAASGEVHGCFETNRAGFTLLHPAGLAGAKLEVGHSDGSVDQSHFPELIAPWQPFQDITSLTCEADGLRVSCQLEGDVFEMEDQRQWGDASFKTYNRPLALPWPYRLESGARLFQAVTLHWESSALQSPAAPARPATSPAAFPAMALVLTPEEARHPEAATALALVKPQHVLCHIDATLPQPLAAQMADFAQLQSRVPGVDFDLELLCRFEAETDPGLELQAAAEALARSGLQAASVMICPSVDRQSTPPGSEWPPCPPLDQIHLAAAQAFASLRRGGGMASFFPELNRKPPPAEGSPAGDGLSFISHGITAITHAADDGSVMEMLETLPHIARSARAIIGGRGYRLGPSTIAMRQNPYGSRTIPNPTGGRVAMAADDPRHRAAFGAAWTLGLAAGLSPFGLEVWTPAALFGPRGITGPNGEIWPLTRLLARLSAMAGAPVIRAETSSGLVTLQLGGVMFRANLTALPQAGLAPFGWEESPA